MKKEEEKMRERSNLNQAATRRFFTAITMDRPVVMAIPSRTERLAPATWAMPNVPGLLIPLKDYFTLRERIVTVTKQVGYLQGYIKAQCID